MTPVAFFHTSKRSPIEAARQGSIDQQSFEDFGEIRFESGQQFEQALEDIEGFSHLWVIYQFHLNADNWKPKVSPPRGTDQKRGVFATRSPYRPNGLGLSCVELVEKKGLSLWVRGFDLLDGTPIWDIKPYLAYSDSFPEASMGWLASADQTKFSVSFSKQADEQILFLESQGKTQTPVYDTIHLRNIVLQQLSFDPANSQKKRISMTSETEGVFAAKTWRFQVTIDLKAQNVLVKNILSGYSNADIANTEDKYQDKELHRLFIQAFYR